MPELPQDVASVLAVAAYPSRSACKEEVRFSVLQNPQPEVVQARRERRKASLFASHHLLTPPLVTGTPALLPTQLLAFSRG